MATLQEQADSKFKDPSTLAEEQARDEAVKPLDSPVVQYADEDDDYPEPPTIETDGKPLNRDTTEIEYPDAVADDGIHGSGGQPPRQVQPRQDIHSAEDSPGAIPLSGDLLARARRYGFSDDYVRKQFGSDEELENALLVTDQQAMRQYDIYRQQQLDQQRLYQQQQIRQQQQPMPPPPTQQPPTQQQVTQQQRFELEQYKLKHPELFDDDLVADLDGMSQHYSGQLTQQQQRMLWLSQVVEQQQRAVQHLVQQRESERQQRELEDFDKQVRSMGPAWEEVFGTESWNSLPADSPQMKNRAKAYETAQQFRWLGQMQGRQVNLLDVLPSSLQHNFPQRSKQSNSQPRDNRGRFSARPTGRNRTKAGNEEVYQRWDRAFGVEGGGDSY